MTILSFFNFHKTLAHPFNPILLNIDQFELDICEYLNGYANGQFTEKSISQQWSSKKAVDLIGLILVVLASGAHFSNLDHDRRTSLLQEYGIGSEIDCRRLSSQHQKLISYDPGRGSFEALRIGNFLFQPSIENIQTLLLLGNTLQNSGQSDASWALLGTTIRLAQTMGLGLHSEDSVECVNEQHRNQAKRLW